MEEANGLSRRMALLAGLGFAATPALARAQAGGGWAAVDTIAKGMVSDKATPGVQIAVMRGARFVYSKGFGAANLETGTPVGPTSVFHIGSVSKQFTAAALLQLQEQGRISVEDRLSKFLPEVPRAGEVSLRQMLTHTSGIGNYTDTKTPEIFLQRSRTDYPPDLLLKAMLGTDPMFIGDPGAQWAYSNTAFVLLGLVIEKVTGKSYAEALRHGVLDRAGLIRTDVDDAAQVVPGRASGYSPDDKAPSGFQNASFISMTYPGAAGSMRSTAEELCRWHEALLGGRILKPESLKAMTTPVLLSNGKLPTQPTGPKPDDPTKPVEYGFGIGIQHDEHGLSLAHGGGIQGFGAYVASYPDAGVRMSFIVNCDGPKVGPGTKALRQEILKAAFA